MITYLFSKPPAPVVWLASNRCPETERVFREAEEMISCPKTRQDNFDK